MHKRGIIDYSEVKGVSHKLVTRIYRDCPEIKDYVPKYSLKRVKKANTTEEGSEQNASGYPKV